MKFFKNEDHTIKRATISGWGRKNFVKSQLIKLRQSNQIKDFILSQKSTCFITRGLGRSYGDAAQLKDDVVLNLNLTKEIKVSGDEVTVGSDASISEILKVIVPLGYILPVLPGSANITIGGAIAADVHGKNHHKFGSIGNHISRILVIDGKGEFVELKPQSNDFKDKNNFFYATIGGMGLTGVIIEATIRMIKIQTSFIKVDTYVCDQLDSLMDLMRKKDKEYSYSVAWIDSLHKKGRGVITCGEHAMPNDLNNNYSNILDYDSTNRISTPKFIPDGILNKFTVKAFNEIWFQKSIRMEKNIQTISEFFHPLDGLRNWNRIYGSKGFYQYQFVIPDDKSYFIQTTLDRLKKSSAYSFLTVLKRFGKSNEAFLSFPEPGWTLAIDLPAHNKNILLVLEELDKELSSLGGKLYLAKDLRQTSEMFKSTYSLYPKWRSFKDEMDPFNIFQSDLSRRLRI